MMFTKYKYVRASVLSLLSMYVAIDSQNKKETQVNSSFESDE